MTLEWTTQLPQELAVFLVAAMPVVELRGSIPLGIAVFGMSIPLVVFWSVLGNMVPLLLIYGLGDIWIRFCQWRRGFWEKLTWRVLNRAQRKLNDKYVRYGLWALVLFVAIPLPVTGAWTGLLAAYIFGIPAKKVWPYVLLGVCLAATVVTLATTGVIAGASFILK